MRSQRIIELQRAPGSGRPAPLPYRRGLAVPTRVRELSAVVLLAVPAALPAQQTSVVQLDGEVRTARYLDSIRDDPARLLLFLRELPKGGDIHTHLSGAIYAETYIDWAAQAGLCARLDNSLEHAFVEGESLWREARPGVPAAACAGTGGMMAVPCRALVERSVKARLQWQLEHAFRLFEQVYGAQQR
jgi:hypothetical protein